MSPTPKTDSISHVVGALAADWVAGKIYASDFVEATEVCFNEVRAMERAVEDKDLEIQMLRRCNEQQEEIIREQKAKIAILAEQVAHYKKGIVVEKLSTALSEAQYQLIAFADKYAELLKQKEPTALRLIDHPETLQRT